MKRIIILGLLAQLAIGSAFAQHENAVLVKSDTIRTSVLDEVATGLNGQRVVDNAKDPRAKYYWFVDGGIGGGFYIGELNRTTQNILSRTRTAAQIGIGKWILPHWAIRLGLGYSKFAGDYITYPTWNVYDEGSHSFPTDIAKEYNYTDAVGNNYFSRKFEIMDAQVDFIYDFNSLFTNRQTPFDTYLYAGLGYAHAFKSQGASANTSLAFKAGFNVSFNVTKNFYIKGAVEGAICDEGLDGIVGGFDGQKNRTVEGYVQTFVGLGFKFGDKKTKKYTYTSVDNIERTYKKTVNEVYEDYNAPFVVRFFIDQYNIEQDQELNIAKVCKYLQAHPNARLLMTGHADPETANPKYNQALTERRCNSVLKYIDKNYGISHDRIEVKPMGDTQRNFDEDFRWNRCVILTIIDK